MKIYLAAPWVSRETEVPSAVAAIEAAGHTLTERWWDHPDVGAYPHAAVDDDLLELQAQAEKDVLGVMEADAMVVLQTEKSEGKAVEQGIAVAMLIPVVVVSKEGLYGNLFQYTNLFKQVATVEEAIDALEEL